MIPHQNISNAIPPQTQTHERAEIIPMGQVISFMLQTTDDCHGTILSLLRQGFHPIRQEK